MAAKIIQFPAKHSNAYNNLSQLIGIADTVKAVNFYAETVDYMKNTGKYLPGEYEKLVEAYRSKRLELAQEKPQGTFETEKPGVYTYTPEMG